MEAGVSGVLVLVPTSKALVDLITSGCVCVPRTDQVDFNTLTKVP